jgi:hypothetical protein
MCYTHANQLVATKKKDLSIAMYFSAMHRYTDEMAAAGKEPDDDDIVSYIFNGIYEDYNSLIEQINVMTEPINIETLYSRLLDTEACLVSVIPNSYTKTKYSLYA